MPEPGRARAEEALALNLQCEGCHPQQAEEWRGSLHQRAALEPAYLRALAIEPMPFCRGCHAPEADPRKNTPAALAGLGVGCVTCHVTDNGSVLAVPPAPGNAERPAPHPVAREARFAATGACAGCHEFAFPGAFTRGGGALMQSTVSEHQSSGFSEVSCAGCHMPRVNGRRRHDFTASRSPELLTAALRVVAYRPSETRVVLELASVGVGHAFPTGDLFRRLEVSAEAQGPDESSLGGATVWLKRHFSTASAAGGRLLERDDRLTGAPRTLELEVGEAARGRPIVWRVAYQRVLHPNGYDDHDVTLEGDVPLAWGSLPAPDALK